MAFHNVKNNAGSTLVNAVTSGATSMEVVVDNFPTSPFWVTIDNEIIEVTAKDSLNSKLWTITRGCDGTTAASHSLGAEVKQKIVAEQIKELQGKTSGIFVGRTQTEVVATGDTTKDTANLQEALNTGGFINISGEFNLVYDGSSPQILFTGKPCAFFGKGFEPTKLLYPATLPTNVDVLRVVPPNNATGNATMDYEYLIITCQDGAAIAGRHAVFHDFSADGIRGLIVHTNRCKFGHNNLAGKAFASNKSPTKEWATAWSHFKKSWFYGGIYIERMSDNITIKECGIQGKNIGIQIDEMVPGANMLRITDNASTAEMGFCKIGTPTGLVMPMVFIQYNDTESWATEYHANIWINGPVKGGEIVGNTSGAYNNGDGIRIDYGEDILVDSNWPQGIGTGNYDIKIGSTAKRIKVGKNNIYRTASQLGNFSDSTVML